MKTKLVKAYMDTAKIFAELSHARRLHVGCIVVKDDRIISIGYNGMPAGWDNNCEYEHHNVHDDSRELRTRPEVLHAESNCLAKIARSHESAEGADMFITHAPCLDCAKLIYQSGIHRVYYGQQYRSDTGIQFLNQSSIQVIYTGE